MNETKVGSKKEQQLAFSEECIESIGRVQHTLFRKSVINPDNLFVLVPAIEVFC